MNQAFFYSSNMRVGFVLLALLLATMPAFAEPKGDEKEIMRLTDVINAAWLKHDVATISPLIADDMQAWSFKGTRRGKAELLRAVEKSEESETSVEDPVVRCMAMLQSIQRALRTRANARTVKHFRSPAW
jgi:hypothetical protein